MSAVLMSGVLPLLRYQLSFLLRSQRWLPPVLLYAFLLVTGWFGGQQYGDSLGWCAGMLVPTCGWLTRTALALEPGSARAVAAAATVGGMRRVRGTALAVALGCGLVLGALGGLFEVVTSSAPTGPHAPLASIVADGLVAVLVGVLAGTAVGALPIPGRAAGTLTLTATSLLLLVLPVSPVNAAIRQTFTSDSAYAAASLPWLPLLGSLLLLTLCFLLAVREE